MSARQAQKGSDQAGPTSTYESLTDAPNTDAGPLPYEPAPALQRLHSSGYKGAAKLYIGGAMLAAGQAADMALKFVRNPVGFFYRKDRRFMADKEVLPGLVHQDIEANGIRVHTVSLGRQPQKPLMLFLHGFPEFWYSWRHLLKRYASDYDAVAIDMRGYGLSEKPPGVSSYRLDILATDVVHVIKGLGHDQAILVAHDWGGIVAWTVAGMYPERVDRLITMAGPHLGLAGRNATPTQRQKSSYIALFQLPFLPELLFMNNDLAALSHMLSPGSKWGPTTDTAFSEEDRDWYKWALSQPRAITAMLNYYRALGRHLTYAPIPEVWKALKRKLPMPCMALLGDKDGAIEPNIMNSLDQVAPISELHVLANTSHWVACDQPQKVIELMDAFLQKHPPTQPRSRL